MCPEAYIKHQDILQAGVLWCSALVLLSWGRGGGWISFCIQKLFIHVMLRLCTEFNVLTMSGTGQKVCGRWVVVGGV